MATCAPASHQHSRDVNNWRLIGAVSRCDLNSPAGFPVGVFISVLYQCAADVRFFTFFHMIIHHPYLLTPILILRTYKRTAGCRAILLALVLFQTLTSCADEQAGAPISRSRNLALDEKAYRIQLNSLKATELAHIVSKRENMLDLVLDLHSESAIAASAEQAGLDRNPEVAAHLKRVRQTILSTALLRKAMLDAEIPQGPELEELAREHYLRFREQYTIPERRRVAHILSTKPQYCPCEVEEPLEAARRLRARIESGQDFAGLARANSHDISTANKGGELPFWVQEDGKTVAPFEDAVFALKAPGEISAPIQSSFGIHLIKLLEIEKARVPPFEEIRKRIEEKLINDVRNNAAEQVRSQNYPDPDTVDFAALEKLIAELRKATSANASQGVKPAAPDQNKNLDSARQPKNDQPK